MSKHDLLIELAAKRQRSRWSGYKNVGDFHGGAYECDYVSPYTKSASNVDAQVMVILQDWRSEDFMSRSLDPEVVRLGHTPSLETNRNLKRLLREHLALELSEVYATNLFPFIKPGPMNAKVPMPDLVRAAREFGLPQVEVVRPKLAVCLGFRTYNAIRVALGERRCQNMAAAIASPSTYGPSLIYCQSHPGRYGTMNRNRTGRDLVSEDWAAMAEVYRAL